MTMGATPKVNPWVIGGAALAAGILAGADVYDQYVEGVQADADAAAYRGLVESAADAAKIRAAEDARAEALKMATTWKEGHERSHHTAAVLVTDRGVIVAGSGKAGLEEPQLAVRPPGSIIADNVPTLHAEQNALLAAGLMGARPLALGVAPWAICERKCQPWIHASGGRLTTKWTAIWHAPGLTEALFLGGSYLQGRESIADVETIEVLAGVPRARRTPGA